MSLPFDSAASLHSSKRFLLRLVAIVAVLNAIVIALALLALHKSRVRYDERAVTAATNIAVFQERDLASTVEQVDLVLQTIADEALEAESEPGLDGQALDAFIQRQRARVPALHGLRITDARGDVIHGPGMVKGLHANLADRPYFIQLARDPRAGIVISKPLVSRVSAEWELVLARRLNGRDGEFHGVVYATIPLQYFIDKFAAIDLGAHGVVALRDEQLDLVARWPAIRSPTQDVGTRTVAAPLRDAVASGAISGSFSGQAGSDGVDRTMAFRRIGALPMFIIVGLGQADYLADWHAEIMRATALGSLFAFVTFVFALTIHRSWLRREADVDALALQERKFRTLLDSSPDGLVITDALGVITLVNRNAELMFGYAADELVGQPLRVLLPARFRAFALAPVATGAGDAGEGAGPRDLWAVTKAGREFPIGISVSSIATEQGGLVAAAIRDMTERHASARHIEFLAHHDALTALPNRTVMESRFEQAVADAARSGAHVALMFLDLDSFKSVNDSLGHPVGDELLKGVALRLGQFARATDIISRQGGDEFLIVLTGLANDADIGLAADRLRREFKAPFVVDGHEIATTLSVGIALYPQDGADFPTLLKKADIAMYQAKAEGRDTWRRFSDQMHVETLGRHRIRSALHQAIERGEFTLHFQPQIDLDSGRVIGAEALLRWNHGELGAVPPAEFIPVAEESGLIVPIGAWVLAEACRQAVSWQAPGRPPLSVAVNISAVQFARGDLEDTVRRALASSGLAPELLELELTESVLIRNVDSVLATVMRLKRLGVMLSIDDFGTGYSSLTYLKRFAVDKLKIDQSFIRDLVTDPESAAIVQAIVQMAHSLNLRTVAEGIEDEGAVAHLKALGCDQGQGYGIARPMPARALLEFLAAATEGWPQPPSTEGSPRRCRQGRAREPGITSA
jgi:diguanylate cyclase (GGDEF)-like protein/PAS domain S-box-containing protein